MTGEYDLGRFKTEMKKRTKIFAHNCVKSAVNLPSGILENHIKKQLIRCSTSVAANYRASCIAQTIPSVISKMSIAIEEADESEFWLEFALEEDLFTADDIQQLLNEAHEITSILIKSRQTLQQKK